MAVADPAAPLFGASPQRRPWSRPRSASAARTARQPCRATTTILVFRPRRDQYPPAWLRAGERISVMAGRWRAPRRNPHRAGADYALGRQERQAVAHHNTIATLFVPLPATLAHIARAAPLRKWTGRDGWIEVALPRAWWRPGGRPAEPRRRRLPAHPTRPASPCGGWRYHPTP